MLRGCRFGLPYIAEIAITAQRDGTTCAVAGTGRPKLPSPQFTCDSVNELQWGNLRRLRCSNSWHGRDNFLLFIRTQITTLPTVVPFYLMCPAFLGLRFSPFDILNGERLSEPPKIFAPHLPSHDPTLCKPAIAHCKHPVPSNSAGRHAPTPPSPACTPTNRLQESGSLPPC